jgi:hypothetical protein
MAVTVTPETFTMVGYDGGAIASIAERLIADVGLPAECDVHIRVDETTPLGRAKITSLEPVTIEAESGAFEDPKKPRQLSDVGTADVLGRLLFQVRDRLDPAFGNPPADDEMSLPLSVAWDVYAVGRLARLGYHSQRQRRLYHFRNRHGFTDVADGAFEELWTSSALTWTDIERVSTEALEANGASA